jgi:hypothetical protein
MMTPSHSSQQRTRRAEAQQRCKLASSHVSRLMQADLDHGLSIDIKSKGLMALSRDLNQWQKPLVEFKERLRNYP